MSHHATHWLAELPASDLTASEFRVLFYLCDCHNPSQGCFPTQAFLMHKTGVSNGTLNNALKSLEAKGIIVRRSRYDNVAKKRLPTRYLLGFELEANHTPDSGERAEPNSSSEQDLTPISPATNLQPTGEVTCKEISNEAVRAPAHSPSKIGFPAQWKPDEELTRWARSQGWTDHDIERQIERCSIYYRQKRVSDPDWTWRKWMEREKEYRTKPPSSSLWDDPIRRRKYMDRKYGPVS
ncbi:helix-turn-helix domain-containing protein [Marimonas sp. MJW-29]|uniref:Helix-turn-helix domain-containing protein n=1 Tax=Sulfitobacter sediminis TaxID=3234186 RepID=A0ABV3RM14_9RHOB